MDSIYVPCIKNGMHDLRGLIEIDSESKKKITPIILTAGTVFSPKTGEIKKDHLLDGFIHNWSGGDFIVDASRTDSDIKSEYNEHHGLVDQSNNFSRKLSYYQQINSVNKNLIPAVSWHSKDDLKNIIQLLINLKLTYEKIAIIVNPNQNGSLTTLDTLLCLFNDNDKIKVIINYGSTFNSPLPSEEEVTSIIKSIHQRGVEDIILLSSSFPHLKPAEKDEWTTSPCTDLAWQLMIINRNDTKANLIYGDYAASSPLSASEFIPGMKIIPSATYFNDGVWYQIKSGRDKEFSVYVDIAKNIVSNDFFDNFCWATKNILKISTSKDGYGNSGVWNGYKVNIHIEEILRILQSNVMQQLYDEDEE
ncbi:beta family protein [Providencia stuartii]